MANKVTVVPADKLIIVDGVPLHCNFEAPANLHAIQWDGQQGHAEYEDGPNQSIITSNATIKSYVDLWQAEKTRLQQEAVAAAAAAAQAASDSESATSTTSESTEGTSTTSESTEETTAS